MFLNNVKRSDFDPFVEDKKRLKPGKITEQVLSKVSSSNSNSSIRIVTKESFEQAKANGEEWALLSEQPHIRQRFGLDK